jgi:hypothetical protein
MQSCNFLSEVMVADGRCFPSFTDPMRAGSPRSSGDVTEAEGHLAAVAAVSVCRSEDTLSVAVRTARDMSVTLQAEEAC